MPRLFSTRADLSGMDGKNDLSISGVYHKAYVKVDELGTEAAGGTAVTGGVTSVTPRNDFRADHPFIFLIQDNQTGNILFLGRVVDPTK
jgi:serpin B